MPMTSVLSSRSEAPRVHRPAHSRQHLAFCDNFTSFHTRATNNMNYFISHYWELEPAAVYSAILQVLAGLQSSIKDA
jgi:hypothetical protein